MSPGFNSQFCAQFSLFVGLTCIWGHSVTQKMKAKIDEKLLWEMGSDSVSINCHHGGQKMSQVCVESCSVYLRSVEQNWVTLL